MSDEDEWTAADEWASWMFPGAYLPRFEDLPKARWSEARLGKPLHERMQQFIDSINPKKAAPRDPWMPDLHRRTPGDAGDYWAGRITDFTVTVDNLETRDDLEDAARMFLAGHVEPDDWGMPERREDGRPVGYDEMVDQLKSRREDRPVRDQADIDEVDWEKAAEEMEYYGPDRPDVIHIHPSVFPGDARTLAEAEALVGMHPKHETLEELPGPCILCGADEVYVTVRRDVDGEIVWSKLTCQDCGWEVSSDEEEPGPAGEVPRYCPSCGEDHVRVTITYREGEAVETQLQCSRCEPGQQ